MGAREGALSAIGNSDSATGGFEPRPPTFTELITAITQLWNPRTRTFFTREEAQQLIMRNVARRRGYVDDGT